MGSDLILKLQEKLTNIQNQLENQSKKLKEAEEEKLILQEQVNKLITQWNENEEM